jgi:glycosyltransferase involved in cell wall biosynthesis
MEKIHADFPAACCLILGEGNLHGSLKKQIESANLTDSVRLLGFRSDALSILAAADLFVLPSLAEPFGLAIVEAMALSKPVIATNAGGPREIVEHQVTGLIVAPNDPEDLANALRKMLSDPDYRRQLAANGYARFKQHFTSDRMARSMLDVYQRIRTTGTPATAATES